MQFTRHPRSNVARIIPFAVITAFLLLVGLNPAAPVAAQPSSTCEAIQDNPGLKSDCGVLLSVRDTLAGNADLDWSSSTPMSAWTGVTISGTPARVTGIDLANSDLTGTIPPELGNLAKLRSLDLYSNALRGEIPPELGNLARLEFLYLGSNALRGEVPPELGNLSELRSLWLDFNDLTGEIPPQLGNLSNLRELWSDFNDLRGEIPPQLGNLSKLRDLLLGYNDLTGEIPPELGNLSNLRALWLEYNALTGEIPSELGDLSELRSLGLDNNDLSGELPPELGNLSNLNSLTLQNNNLTGCIPRTLRDIFILHDSLPLCADVSAVVIIVLGPGSANQVVNLEWPDGEPISVTLRVSSNLPSYVPGSITPGAGASYQIGSWGSNPRTITFFHPDHADIVLQWSYDPDHVDEPDEPVGLGKSIVMGPSSPNQVVDLEWPDGEPISATLRVSGNLPSYVPGSINPGVGASYQIAPWGSNPRTITFSHPDHADIVLEWSYDPDYH